MPVEDQVISIYAGVSGRLDKVDIADVGRYERELLQFIRSSHPELCDRVLNERQDSTSRLNAGLAQALDQAFDEFEARAWRASS
jgi:F-type H+-transporting ATPase subunit alpha